MSVFLLDNQKSMAKLDGRNMLSSLQLLSKQAEQLLIQSKSWHFPSSYLKVDNIVVAGMGGSALGAHFIKTVFVSELKLPVEIINDYVLPKYVGKNTLVIASTYSGNTEETLHAAAQAKAMVVAITTGGKLLSLAKKNNFPAIVFTTENNPCGSPRMGLGYSIIGQLILFSRLGLLKTKPGSIKAIIKALSDFDFELGVSKPSSANKCKQIAMQIKDRSVWFIGAEHLVGNAHIAANQMNENAKRLSGYFAIPELNHHLLEGMKFPVDNNKKLLFVFFDSELYSSRIQKRFRISKQVLEKNKIPYVCYECIGKERFLQASEVLVFGSYLSYYTALLNNIDPTPIPWVDYFKEQMEK